MNQNDKVKHIESVQKELTSICFNACFGTKKFKVDDVCVKNCYQKYLFSLNHVQKIVTDEGRKVHSDFVRNAVGEAPRDRFVEEIFPKGGVSNQQAEGQTPWRKKFQEGYLYSNPETKGR